MNIKAFATLIAAPPLALSSITCLDVGTSAIATWTNSDGQACSFTGVVGSNYGSDSDGSGE